MIPAYSIAFCGPRKQNKNLSYHSRSGCRSLSPGSAEYEARQRSLRREFCFAPMHGCGQSFWLVATRRFNKRLTEWVHYCDGLWGVGMLCLEDSVHRFMLPRTARYRLKLYTIGESITIKGTTSWDNGKTKYKKRSHTSYILFQTKYLITLKYQYTSENETIYFMVLRSRVAQSV
jgi:hypothetical protein